MKVVWSKNPIYARDIVDTVAQAHDWHPKTVRTLLARLVRKGVASFKKDGRAYVYFPMRSEAECVRAESEAFLKRVFRGNLTSLFVHFVETRKISPDDLRELRRLVRAR